MMNLLQRIKALCVEKSISISEIERACHLPEKSLYKWNKNMPSVEKLSKVALFLRVDSDYLLGLSLYRTRFEEWNEKYNSEETKEVIRMLEKISKDPEKLRDLISFAEDLLK